MIELSHETTDGLIDSGTNDFFFKIFETNLFVTRSVGELISGYSDPLLGMASTLLAGIVKNDKFSLLNGVSIALLFKRSNVVESTFFSLYRKMEPNGKI